MKRDSDESYASINEDDMKAIVGRLINDDAQEDVPSPEPDEKDLKGGEREIPEEERAKRADEDGKDDYGEYMDKMSELNAREKERLRQSREKSEKRHENSMYVGRAIDRYNYSPEYASASMPPRPIGKNARPAGEEMPEREAPPFGLLSGDGRFIVFGVIFVLLVILIILTVRVNSLSGKLKKAEDSANPEWEIKYNASQLTIEGLREEIADYVNDIEKLEEELEALKNPGNGSGGVEPGDNQTDGPGSSPPPTQTAAPTNPPPNEYIVKKGETLWGLAQRFYKDGSKYVEIMKANGLTSETVAEGQRLIIPNL